MAELFLSYSKHNRPQALDLADELRVGGFSVWIDQGGIEGAQNWSAEIVEGINACSTFILLISPESVASRNVAREVHLAFEKRKNILPVILENVPLPPNIEYSLAGLQQIYYHDRPAILRALQLLRTGLPATEQLPRRSAPELDDTFIRVAVLPFADLSQLHDNQWFADGMMDELIGTLGRIDKVKVPSRSDVLHYREHKKKSWEIANELGVRHLIEGAVRKAGERIRVNVTLIDTRTIEQLWGNQFDGTFDDVFAFQESVAKNVTEALKLHLTPQEKQQIETRPTQNAEAYQLYLKGKHEQYYVSKESYERALEFHEQAAALDPMFTKPHIGIASVCCAYYREYSKDPKWLKRAEASLAKAEAVTGETSMSLYIRGMIEWLKGDDDRAIVTLTRSSELDPKSYNPLNILGIIQLENSNYPAAIEALQKVADLVENTMSCFNLLAALSSSEETERLVQTAQKALPVFERYLLREPKDLNATIEKGFILQWAGRDAEASEIADLLFDRDDLSGQTLYQLGSLYNQLGKPELNLTLLRKAIKHGYREIEGMRNATFESKDSMLESEFKSILNELEELIEREAATTSD